ncbi:MAG: DUF2779 domain-containing protein [Candidatus Staskawiczbacteria bacterium]|nr:DUF2779 domain-containing protein [Candidatus Staskawiczbacteria bacterium]MBI3337312.1 DUF2779 domain-containing protein [Candidatus Staskawiczbacteria bacterium]
MTEGQKRKTEENSKRINNFVKLISKSRFLEYRACPKDAWFRLYMPELDEFKISISEQGRMDQGNIAEEHAKKLDIFSGFVEIKTRNFDSRKEIDLLMSQKAPAIYQPTFVADGFIVRCDMLVCNESTGKWDLYEIKATNSIKNDDSPRDHISDLSFQTIVLERAEIDIGKKFIVHLNNKYIRKGDIDIENLFLINDSTEQVSAKIEITAQQMENAKKYLNQKTEPKNGCNCHLYGRSRHCATFGRSHPEIPEYSIHDLLRIGSSPSKLAEFVKNETYDLGEIGDTSDFSVTQQNQINTYKNNKEIINEKEISNILDEYKYPLYFFDYETFAPAIPIYSGYGTWQRIPIQFSLHIIDKKGGPLRHVEYLHQENSDPSEIVAKKLNEYIDPKGTVLAWNVSFEKNVTKEIAARLSKYEKVLNRICLQMKDLSDIFSKQHYVHKDFRGRFAIEAVMKVLLPEMTYENLPYTGEDVGYVWWQDIANQGLNPKERDQKAHLIKEYCKQDTFIMVEIFRILNDFVSKK